jgi:hypothetical protein
VSTTPAQPADEVAGSPFELSPAETATPVTAAQPVQSPVSTASASTPLNDPEAEQFIDYVDGMIRQLFENFPELKDIAHNKTINAHLERASTDAESELNYLRQEIHDKFKFFMTGPAKQPFRTAAMKAVEKVTNDGDAYNTTKAEWYGPAIVDWFFDTKLSINGAIQKHKPKETGGLTSPAKSSALKASTALKKPETSDEADAYLPVISTKKAPASSSSSLMEEELPLDLDLLELPSDRGTLDEGPSSESSPKDSSATPKESPSDPVTSVLADDLDSIFSDPELTI